KLVTGVQTCALPISVGALGPGVRPLPRRGMGPPGGGRRRTLRAALPRGVPVRAVLADDPAQARGVPGGVRRLSNRSRRPVRRARSEERRVGTEGGAR